MFTGIYKIINLVTNGCYIGSAVDYKRRFRQHLHLLRHNKHHSNYLQRSWNKHGENNFKFELILCCKKQDLIEFEQLLMDVYKPQYNLSPKANSRLGQKASEETRRKLSESHKGLPNPNKGKKRNIPSWNKGIPQTKETKRKLSEASKGKHYSIKSEFKKGQKNPKIFRKILCIDLELCFISITEAALFCGNIMYQFNIAACARGKQKTAYGHTWKFI